VNFKSLPYPLHMTAINPRHSSFKLAILFALIHSVYPFLTPTTAATISSSFSTTTSYSSSVTSISTPSTDNTLSSALAMSDSSQNQNDNISQGQTIGFIGCGTIASAIATGLLTQQNPDHLIHKVYVTKRSEAKSAALSNRFGQKIVVTEDNQNIVDHSDILFLCVLPQHEESVLKALDIPHDKTLISLISTSKLFTLIQNSKLPPSNVYKMICLPAVADLEGTPLLVPTAPSTSNLPSLISTLGGSKDSCIQCENEDIMEAMMVSTCMMGPVYGLLKANRDFLIEKGVPAKDANNVVARQYWGMTKDALVRSQEEGREIDSLDVLIEEQTPGGLNEQTLRNLESAGVMDRYKDAMESVLARIQGKTDGSMMGGK